MDSINDTKVKRIFEDACPLCLNLIDISKFNFTDLAQYMTALRGFLKAYLVYLYDSQNIVLDNSQAVKATPSTSKIIILCLGGDWFDLNSI